MSTLVIECQMKFNMCNYAEEQLMAWAGTKSFVYHSTYADDRRKLMANNVVFAVKNYNFIV